MYTKIWKKLNFRKQTKKGLTYKLQKFENHFVAPRLFSEILLSLIIFVGLFAYR